MKTEKTTKNKKNPWLELCKISENELKILGLEEDHFLEAKECDMEYLTR